MLGNCVNLDDLTYLLENAGRIPELVRRAFMSRDARVVATWSSNEGKPATFGSIPRLEARFRRFMSGDPSRDHVDYFRDAYLGHRTHLTALSLGCGEGASTVRWARTGQFEKIVGIDLAGGAIRTAQGRAEREGVVDRVDFRVADVQSIEFEERSFDCVFADHCLHHFTPLSSVIEAIERWLKPDGHLLAWEFVGPSRFQWTSRQLEAARGLLEVIPREWRRQNTNGRIKRNVPRPSRLRMLIGDPSEAVESARIVPLLDEHLERVELRPCGGTILHPLLHGIAHHFATDDPVRNELLDVLIAAEDTLLAAGDIRSDFAVGIYRKR